MFLNKLGIFKIKALNLQRKRKQKRMKNINEKSKEWCSEHSNKGCTEQCDGCWQLKQALGCEQHNMETAYKAGANYVLEHLSMTISVSEDGYLCDNLRKMIEQLKKK